MLSGTRTMRSTKPETEFEISQKAEELVHKLEAHIQYDPGNRGVSFLHQPGELLSAVMDLHRAKHVAIVTGFPCCPFDPPTETDGPAGAVALARAAIRSKSKKSAQIITDKPNYEVLQECLKVPHLANDDISVTLFHSKEQIEDLFQPNFQQQEEENGVVVREVSLIPTAMETRPTAATTNRVAIDHLIAIERSGPSRDGCCYTMSGRDITDLNAPIWELFEFANRQKSHSSSYLSLSPFSSEKEISITTTGIGDGGNEIGMGKVSHLVEKHIPNGSKIACVTQTDNCITAGVSNWGGYALACALFIVEYSDVMEACRSENDATPHSVSHNDHTYWISQFESMLPSDQSESELFSSLDDVGAHDGMFPERKLSVDGIFLTEHLKIIRELKDITKQIFEDSSKL